MKVATKDRFENLLIPQIPCPDVQPLPIFVPAPTNNPAKINNGTDEEILKFIFGLTINL